MRALPSSCAWAVLLLGGLGVAVFGRAHWLIAAGGALVGASVVLLLCSVMVQVLARVLRAMVTSGSAGASGSGIGQSPLRMRTR